VTLDGKVYKGDRPFTEGGSRTPKSGNPIRSIRNNGPAVPAAGKMANSAAMACGREQIASVFTAPVTAGSKVTIDWGNWPHNSGPLITYLGKCTNNDCSKTDPTKVNWFKIHEVGFEPGTTKWVQDTVVRLRKPFTFTLPKNVPSGKFLMRHEIIALHLADRLDGAEFYPTCIQVDIKGGTGSIPSQTVKFPGGYKNSDAGIHFNIFTGSANLKKYKIPGPPIALGGTATGTDNTEEEEEETSGGNSNTGGNEEEEEDTGSCSTKKTKRCTTASCKAKRAARKARRAARRALKNAESSDEVEVEAAKMVRRKRSHRPIDLEDIIVS
jgi:hypothetical protein